MQDRDRAADAGVEQRTVAGLTHRGLIENRIPFTRRREI
jgi:hypothetical protein